MSGGLSGADTISGPVGTALYFDGVDDGGCNVSIISTAPYLDQWTHHVYVADGVGNLDVYMDNTLVNTISIDSNNDGVKFENIGHAYYNSNNPKEAGIDDVRVYDRVLSDEDRNALFNMGTP